MKYYTSSSYFLATGALFFYLLIYRHSVGHHPIFKIDTEYRYERFAVLRETAMVLSENGKHEIGKAHQEIEMKIKWDSVDEKQHHMKTKKNGENEFFSGEMKMTEEKLDEEDDKDENGTMVIFEEDGCNFGGYNKEVPPVDDVCPICFDRFTVPCRSNCGHWFCASCILEFWVYRSSIQPCKCPLCWSKMVNLEPETSQLIQPTDDIVKILREVQQYNGLYADGVHGLRFKMLALPLFMRRMCRLLIDPDGLRCVYYVMRLLGLLLALLYERGEFEFIPTGGFGIQRMFDMAASLLVIALFVVGVGYRWVVNGRVIQRMVEWDS